MIQSSCQSPTFEPGASVFQITTAAQLLEVEGRIERYILGLSGVYFIYSFILHSWEACTLPAWTLRFVLTWPSAHFRAFKIAQNSGSRQTGVNPSRIQPHGWHPASRGHITRSTPSQKCCSSLGCRVLSEQSLDNCGGQMCIGEAGVSWRAEVWAGTAYRLHQCHGRMEMMLLDGHGGAWGQLQAHWTTGLLCLDYS